MIPGLGGMGGNPRQMAMMMKKLGIDVKDIPNVQRIVIETPDKDYVFDEASVSVMNAQGVETWQVSGSPRVEAKEVKLVIADEDVTMVAEQTGATPEAARKALEDANGDLAEAIVALTDA